MSANPGFGWFRACEGDLGFSISYSGFRASASGIMASGFRLQG